MKKGELPSLAAANGLDLDEMPEQLANLSTLETVFISRRIAFMKMVALPHGKQKAVHGSVVNVPIEPEKLVSILPCLPSPDSVIPVKRKRKLNYRGHSLMQNIRPEKVKNALHYLKNLAENPLYEDVIINTNWENDCLEDHQETWTYLTGDHTVYSDGMSRDMPQPSNNVNNLILEQIDDQEGVISQEINLNADSGDCEDDIDLSEDDRMKFSGLPLDSCLLPKDISADPNFIISIAPGEGKRPLGLESDEKSEELSFPHLFPSGKFGYSMDRKRPVSLKKYFQARVLHADGRFSSSAEYLFYAQYRCEAKDTRDCLSISLRKGCQEDLTAGQIQKKISDLIRNNLGINFLQKVKGSPA